VINKTGGADRADSAQGQQVRVLGADQVRELVLGVRGLGGGIPVTDEGDSRTAGRRHPSTRRHWASALSALSTVAAVGS
jgi:hypothetical protein